MSNAPDSLAALRREIDSIDGSLHDLLMRRSAVVAEIGRRKAAENGPLFRPAREAQLLRRLLARHAGVLPESVIVRVWREIIASAIRQQGDFSVGYCPFDGHGSALRLANGHFGLESPVTRFESAGQVVSAVARGEVGAGIVPLPHAAGTPGWWVDMRAAADVHVVVRLPWYRNRDARDAGPGGFVLAKAVPEESGEDRSLVMFSCATPVSRAWIADLLAENGLVSDAQAVTNDPDGSGGHAHLVDLEGFVSGEDRRVQAVARLLDGADIRWVGAYATPFYGAA
jgi:chorismate mutase/prephenate dehydratase